MVFDINIFNVYLRCCKLYHLLFVNVQIVNLELTFTGPQYAMVNSTDKQAFLIVTTKISDQIIAAYNKLKEATTNLGDVFLLHHTNDNNYVEVEGIKTETFTDDILSNLGYTAIRKTLVPGSNHFPVLNFFLNHPEYKYYWCIEDDVVFSGEWSVFFEQVSALNYDFISSHIRTFKNFPNPWWSWWDTLKTPDGEFAEEDMLNSFNPVYRLSNKALAYVDTCLKNGYSGHHEVLLPSLLNKAGFTLADFSTENNNTTPSLSYCTLKTMRWRPVYFSPGNKKNMLYHPVKQDISFKQLLILFKRTVSNRKEYFT